MIRDRSASLACVFRVASGTGKIDVLVERLLVAVAPQEVERLVDSDTVDPAEESTLRIEIIEMFGHLEKHDLGDVPGVVRAPEDPEGGVVDRALVADHQRGERLAVPFPVALDQRVIDVVIHNYTRPVGKLGRIDYLPVSISKS